MLLEAMLPEVMLLEAMLLEATLFDATSFEAISDKAILNEATSSQTTLQGVTARHRAPLKTETGSELDSQESSAPSTARCAKRPSAFVIDPGLRRVDLQLASIRFQ